MAIGFLRLLAHDDKPDALALAVERLRDGEPSPDVHVAPESFRQEAASRGRRRFPVFATCPCQL
ncbi:MAG: hypothetical protein ABSE84_23340 [Isosphaeraceae bacterium]|jgi:hypothetical protein